ncbi:hypothetical protein BJX99DRAFT_236179 [Aspergillus californicus]
MAATAYLVESNATARRQCDIVRRYRRNCKFGELSPYPEARDSVKRNGKHWSGLNMPPMYYPTYIQERQEIHIMG